MLRTCAICSKEFENKSSTQKYCSDECYKIGARTLAYARFVKRVGDIQPRPCALCGTIFTPQHRRDAKYCTSYCRNRYRKLHQTFLDAPVDPDKFAVTTPYGSHAFDGFVAKYLGGAHA